MELSAIIRQYLPAFEAKYAAQLSSDGRRAIDAMLRCRTPHAGEMRLHCEDCGEQRRLMHSCGHRHCPRCQNHETSLWLDRQRTKLLPVEYFMVTFTLPRELRALARRHPTTIYSLLFATAHATLRDFGLNPKHLGAEIGMSAVLHTHSRRLDYHPHLHVVVPGGGIEPGKRQWIKAKGQYLFNAFALAKVFRARFLAALNAASLPIPPSLPDKWVVDCTHAGKGEPALRYLSRYLYRGVISENNIVANRAGHVTFQYLDSRSGDTTARTLAGEDFLWLILQHVLPKGFRRIRDYGFLHGNAKKRLMLVQLVLRVVVANLSPRPRPAFCCPKCSSPMTVVTSIRPAWQSG